MRYTFLLFVLLLSCTESVSTAPFNSVKIEAIYTDSLSIRAIELMGNSLAFAANKGTFGTVDLASGKVRANVEKYHTSVPAFRAVAHTSTDFFMLSIESPALLYKTGDKGRMELVYKEEGEGVFYDAMTFLNDKDGIAIGDSVDGCLSIIITSDGGKSWSKLPCSQLPEGIEGEGAFAASNTNIKTIGNSIWIATTAGRILFSSDKGKTWKAYQTPIQNTEPTEGIYSIDFYDENLGFAIGGDYTNPDSSKANKAITKDGGKTWNLIADGKAPGYKSCVQFVPASNGKGLVAVGFTGISYSSDMGASWKELSKESFYTLRFQNDSVAYAAGKNRISKLTFK
ncbi:WD40/YVTN/BNR-like repeat-containing protein [Maribacter hydrothermalis]|uniref:Oxidoreductase n=1 Tax=Maribacter hydrothermalis TaxID=1836467 RepID=A0A1B7Z7R1_9FLAO|nr:oxidoreductase [Maribacter hydrothermalis]APQ15905.1 oxidoreductase [Maribacter hydrothermalis]OBR38716.1 oxidoreductase [Maribacter hydrothermalis]